MATNPPLTMEAMHWGLGRLCEERGWHHGVPVFSCTSEGRGLILAKGAPLTEKNGYGPDHPLYFGPRNSDEVDDDDPTDPLHAVNQWRHTPTSVHIYRDKKGTFKLLIPEAHIRFRTLMDTVITRAGAVLADNEITAMQSLMEMINTNQWESYLLSGAFPETSKRSGVSYIFRKGFPTIALRERKIDDGHIQREFLAALCMHPLAYYKNTFCGSYPPSDEVISHLTMMRADEHMYWRKSNQHSLEDPLSGI